MIRVNRGSVEVPSALKGTKSRGVRETKRNSDHFDNNEIHKQTFAAYKDPTVVEALNLLFHRKCAYCEVLMAGQQPGDVDHYRPKAGAVLYVKGGERVKVAGYFWLAASWDNLLPCCVFCNRPNILEIEFEEGDGVGFERLPDDPGKVPRGAGRARLKQRRLAGKSCEFPLAAGSPRRAYPEPLNANERPLLLNPCEDEPSEHLRFTRDGFVVPVQKQDGPSPMGRKTIEVCALNRTELLQLRQAVALEVEERLIEVILDLANGRAPRDSDIRSIERAMDADRPFAAYVRQYVAERIAEHISGIY